MREASLGRHFSFTAIARGPCWVDLLPTPRDLRHPLHTPPSAVSAGMDLSPDTISSVTHPTAAFIPRDTVTPVSEWNATIPPASWEDSQLNPKNRVDSLDPLPDPLWRVDGCTSFGSQYYVVPIFMHPITPLRIDCFVPELSTQSRQTRDLLELDRAFHTKDRARVAELAISKHILRRLQTWTTSLEDPCKYLTDLPFGSRIIFTNLSLDINQIKVEVGQAHALETFLFSEAQFEATWGPEVRLPPAIDISEVQFVEQIHDSTCLVLISGQKYILKALTSFSKYLYHELKLLLTMRPHPNIVSAPVHIVTKQVRFGSKRAVLGFTLEYHEHGTLRDVIPLLSSNNTLLQSDQYKWAVQITSGLLHHRETSGTFYPDLRLDNIVLSSERNAIMVDFEQRGVWCEFAAPEVNTIEYICMLAREEQIPDEDRQQFVDLMEKLCPGYEDLLSREKYTNPPGGYNVSWLSLSSREQEAAEVYMLGRVLWCIFEGVCAPQKSTIWVSYRWESPLQFPEYRRAPHAIRRLIDKCTMGRRPTLDTIVVRQGSRLILSAQDPSKTEPRDVLDAAREWWLKEIGWAQQYLTARETAKRLGEWDENPYNRPRLREVLDELDSIRKAMQIEW